MVKANLSFPFTPSMDRGNPAVIFAEHGFYPFCSLKYQSKCAPIEVKYPDASEIRKMTSVPQKLFYSSYIMGAIAIVFNLIILITVISSRSLRQSTSMVLLTNMAICDLLIGIYSIIIGDLNIFNFLFTTAISPGQKLVLGRRVLCRVTTVIFTSAQCVAAVTSLLLVVEKYCSIVYCMNPNRRLSKKVAFVCIMSAWGLSLGYALSPLHHDSNLSFSPTMMCSFPVSSKSDTFLICLGILVALYIMNIPLYMGIFLFVRQSGANLGIKRETAILKKISLVVATNFFLLLTPLILIITLVPLENIHDVINLNSDKNTQVLFVFGFWFPITCLGLNSCINPTLCTFRQGQFIKQIRKILKLHIMPPHIEALFFRGPNEQHQSSSQLSTASSQIVLYKVTHYDN